MHVNALVLGSEGVTHPTPGDHKQFHLCASE